MTTCISTILIIPCYNEAKRLDIATYRDFLLKNPDFFLLFVNDGSTDKTATALKELEPTNSNFSIIELLKNNGKGEAVRQGVLHCLKTFNFKYIGYCDADLSTPLNEFLIFRNKMIEFLLLKTIKQMFC